MAIRSDYVQALVGILLIVADLGWLLDNLQPYLFPGINLGSAAMFSGLGELVFMLRLLLRGDEA